MKTALLFQGQGGFHPDVVKDLLNRSELISFCQRADNIVLELIGTPFSDWLFGKKSADPVQMDQIGIYLEGFLAAQLLLQRQVHPDFVMGHSFGEFCSLAVAGAISFEDGIRLIHARSLACLALDGIGGMVALASDEASVASLLEALTDHDLEISVINHSRQTVVSGSVIHIERLVALACTRGLGSTVLRSRLPFHSSQLAGARRQFVESARKVTFGPSRVALYLPVERMAYHQGLDMADLLASHLVTRFDFPAAIDDLFDLGVHRFIECAGSAMLCNIVRRVLGERPESVTLAGALDGLLTAQPSTT